MLNAVLQSRFLVAWFALLTVVTASSVALGAAAATSALIFVLGLTPAMIMVLASGDASSPTPAEIPHSTSRDDRR